MRLQPYISKHFLVVGENHGCHVNSMGIKRYTNDIKRVCDTMEEAEKTVKQNNTPVHTDWCDYVPNEMFRITQEAYEWRRKEGD